MHIYKTKNDSIYNNKPKSNLNNGTMEMVSFLLEQITLKTVETILRHLCASMKQT